MSRTNIALLRKLPRIATTALGDQVATIQTYDEVNGQLTEHIVVKHPRDIEQVAFSRRRSVARCGGAK